MNKEIFWNMIGEAKQQAGKDTEKLYDHLYANLMKLDAADIFLFGQYLGAYYLFADTPAIYLAAYVTGNGSDDSFDYFKAWLVAQGEKVYTEALKDPDSLAHSDIEMFVEFELIMGLSFEAYEDKLNETDEVIDEAALFLSDEERERLKSELAFSDLDWGSDEDELLEKIPQIIPNLAKHLSGNEDVIIDKDSMGALDEALLDTLDPEMKDMLERIVTEGPEAVQQTLSDLSGKKNWGYVPDWCNLENRISKSLFGRSKSESEVFASFYEDDEALPEDVRIYGASCSHAEITSYQISGSKNLNDISRLLTYSKLRRLAISDFENGSPELRDFNVLYELQDLEELSLSRLLHLDKLDFLNQMSQLKHLNLMYLDQITDLSPIGGLTNLESLVIMKCPGIITLPDLSKFKRLKSLKIIDCKLLESIEGISGLSSLIMVEVSNSKIFDISPLSQCILLRVLKLNRNKIIDITPLNDFEHLEILEMDRNKVRDLSSLAGLPLRVLDMSGNQIKDVTPLSDMKTLGCIRLEKNKEITDVRPFSDLPDLDEVRLNKTGVTDVSMLKHVHLVDLMYK